MACGADLRIDDHETTAKGQSVKNNGTAIKVAQAKGQLAAAAAIEKLRPIQEVVLLSSSGPIDMEVDVDVDGSSWRGLA